MAGAKLYPIISLLGEGGKLRYQQTKPNWWGVSPIGAPHGSRWGFIDHMHISMALSWWLMSNSKPSVAPRHVLATTPGHINAKAVGNATRWRVSEVGVWQGFRALCGLCVWSQVWCCFAMTYKNKDILSTVVS